ncbi:MAG: hypothetical protein IJ727_05560 [Treponema sp.]|nr:hypothetical protein [Treponema sp.]
MDIFTIILMIDCSAFSEHPVTPRNELSLRLLHHKNYLHDMQEEKDSTEIDERKINKNNAQKAYAEENKFPQRKL